MKRLLIILILVFAFLKPNTADAKGIYNKENHEYLSKIIMHEAGAPWVNDYTRYLVGVVVMKRVKSPLFPNTVKGVALQTNPTQYFSEYEFSKVKPNRKSKKTARILLEGGHKALRCYPDNLVYQANFTQGSSVFRVSNGVYFCLR